MINELERIWKGVVVACWGTIPGVPAEIRTQHLMNTNPEQYRYTNLFGGDMLF
jgi:hypothetical protein